MATADLSKMTVEELVALGYDEETAKAIIESASNTGGAAVPFPVLKFNYDQQDILSDYGIKKGTLIAGWEIDNKNLTVKSEGEVLGEEIEFFIPVMAYQYSKYDTKTKKIVIITDIFTNAFDGKKMIDKKSGKTIGQLKEEGVEGITYNNILLMMVKTKDGLKPYAHYLHGVNYYEFYKQLREKFGIEKPTLMHTIKAKIKKVPTDFQPAWIFEIVDVKNRTPEELAKTAAEVGDAIKKWNAWIEANNKDANVGSQQESAAPASEAKEESNGDRPF